MSDTLVALVGTRKRVQIVIDDVTALLTSLNRQTIIVAGDASGTDAHVRRECDRLGFRCIECHVRKVDGEWAGDWAGPERNAMIARLAQRAVAWPLCPEDEGRSRGTWNCVGQFIQRGKPVEVRDVAWRTT